MRVVCRSRRQHPLLSHQGHRFTITSSPTTTRAAWSKAANKRSITLTSTVRPPVRKMREHTLRTRSARRSGEGARGMPLRPRRRPRPESEPRPSGTARLHQGDPQGTLPPAFPATGERREVYRGHEPRCVARRLPARMPGRRGERRLLHHPVSPNLPRRERPCLAGVPACRLHR